MGLIELVRGMQTSDDNFEATQRLAAHLGKATCVSLVSPCLPASMICPACPACLPCLPADITTPVRQPLTAAMIARHLLELSPPDLLQDRPGFIVNRVLMPMINEAFFALMEVGVLAGQGGVPQGEAGAGQTLSYLIIQRGW